MKFKSSQVQTHLQKSGNIQQTIVRLESPKYKNFVW